MGMWLVIALLLAWPTFGFSILVWLSFSYFKFKSKQTRTEQRNSVKQTLEPHFEGKFAEFFLELDMPIYDWERISQYEADQCGRHVLNYISHNPSETALFIKGLEKWSPNGGLDWSDPVGAAQMEINHDQKGEIHLVTYRAVEAIMTQNKLKCFEKVDLAGIFERKAFLEMQMMKQRTS